MKYQFKESLAGFYKGLSPQEVQEEMERIELIHGYLTPKIIVDAASDKDHMFHPYFEWNNKEAADKWRLQQARTMMAVVVMVSDNITEPIRAIVHITTEEGKSVYQSTEVAMSNPITRKQIVERAKCELDSWRKRYYGYQELSKIHKHVQTFLQIKQS